MMRFTLLFSLFLSCYYQPSSAVILKSSMNNNYSQIAVLGCDSKKPNLYYDTEKQFWIEHNMTKCVKNEHDTLEVCQKAYPNRNIVNIVRLAKTLQFDNWCELASKTNVNYIRRCKKGTETEESVQPFRCLTDPFQSDELFIPSDCQFQTLYDSSTCLPQEQWQSQASLTCSDKKMLLNSSSLLKWCGIAKFVGIEFVCCPSKDGELEPSISKLLWDDKDLVAEDDEIHEFAVPESLQQSLKFDLDDDTLYEDYDTIASTKKPLTTKQQRRLLAANREPAFVESFERFANEEGNFSDDEDDDEDQDDENGMSPNSSILPDQLPKNEHQRFTDEKEAFKKKYEEQVAKLVSQWKLRQVEIKEVMANNPIEGQKKWEATDKEFKNEYEKIKQRANEERLRINDLHERHLDLNINREKAEAQKQLTNAWNEKPIKTENVQKALLSYLHALIRDRLHLVNRYERLRIKDPPQAAEKKPEIEKRLKLIAARINDAVNNLKQYSKLQAKIQSRINTLFSEYAEVNDAAETLLNQFASSSTTTKRIPRLPLGRDEARIYPLPSKPSKTTKKSTTSTTTTTTRQTTTTTTTDDDSEYDATGELYDDDTEEERNDNEKQTQLPNTMTTTMTTFFVQPFVDEIADDDEQEDMNTGNYMKEVVNSWNNNDFSAKRENNRLIVDENQSQKISSSKLMMNPKSLFQTYIPYIVGCVLISFILIGVLAYRCYALRRHYRRGGQYEKNYLFTEVESCSPEERHLAAMQVNGYENPTYKFFEHQTPKC